MLEDSCGSRLGLQCHVVSFSLPLPDIATVIKTKKKNGQGEQIGNLAHAGSHHLAMDTNDVTYGQELMYGRSLCSRVAKECASGNTASRTNVLKNADSFDYLVEGMVAAR